MICAICNSKQESISHLFIDCTITRTLWFSSPWGLRVECLGLSNSKELIQFFLNPSSGNMSRKGGLYTLWGSSLWHGLEDEKWSAIWKKHQSSKLRWVNFETLLSFLLNTKNQEPLLRWSSLQDHSPLGPNRSGAH